MVDSNDIRPILGRKACTGMGILVYRDNDHLNRPETGKVTSVRSADSTYSDVEGGLSAQICGNIQGRSSKI